MAQNEKKPRGPVFRTFSDGPGDIGATSEAQASQPIKEMELRDGESIRTLTPTSGDAQAYAVQRINKNGVLCLRNLGCSHNMV
jgi:hypothetical protein